METSELWMTAVRSAGVFALVLFVIRMMGKRTVGNFTAFDLLVALMLGEVVDEMIYGDVTFLQGTIAIFTLAVVKYATTWLDYLGHGLSKILEGEPTKVVENGEFNRKGMRKELMNEEEVLALLRLQGVDDMKEVKLATVENDGAVSVIKEEWAEPIQKSDIDRRLREQRRGQAPGRDTGPEKETEREEALYREK